MVKTVSHIEPLPAALTPTKSSTHLLIEHVERLRAAGVKQSVISRPLGFGTNYVSMLKAGSKIALPRILAFAAAAQLSDEERHELLNARLMELHGRKGEICVTTIAQWAVDVFTPVGDEARLIEMWREATEAAPDLLVNLIDDDVRAERIAVRLREVVQDELQAMADEAAIP